MDENLNLNEYDKEQIDSTIRRATLKQETIEWLKTNPSIQEYFKNFHPNSIEYFITDYANKKWFWIEHGKFYTKQNLEKDSKWLDMAWEHLAILQQKKLFDAQCLWRAEKSTYANVEIAQDFNLWENNVLNCPFIEPIEEYDIQLYSKYLSSLNIELEQGWFESWQDYDELKEAFNDVSEVRNFPSWYEFHNNHTGNSSYFLLPDIRGEKEEFYMNLTREHNQLKYKEENPTPYVSDKRPYLSSNNMQQLEEFITLFETKEVKQFYKEEKRYNKAEEPFVVDMHQLMFHIENLEEPLAIESHYDYRIALQIAYEKYCSKKIIEFLPQAHEQYVMNMSLQIKQPNDNSSWQEIRDNYANMILEGRTLNGEEANFDF